MTELPVGERRGRGLSTREAALVLVCTLAIGIAAGLIVHVLRTPRAQPSSLVRVARGFHGQGVWAAGQRPAPAFALHDQHGALVSLRSLRGKPVLLVFLDSQCTTECPIAGRQLGSVMRRLPAARRPSFVVVSVDPKGDTARSIAHALRKWKLDGPWGIHWLNAASRAQLAAVWRAYHVTVQPTTNDVVHSLALYLIDKHGDERTAYLFPFLPSFVQTDLSRLARQPA